MEINIRFHLIQFILLTAIAIQAHASQMPEPVNLEQKRIRLGVHKESGAGKEVPGISQPEQWPLGDPSIQPCQHCIKPNRQNATRLKEPAGQP